MSASTSGTTTPGRIASTGHDLGVRRHYRAWTRISIRYNDLDPLGHVNNAAMAIFLEQARCELITPALKAVSRGFDMVLAQTTMSYLAELHYPGAVEVGTIATRIGTKSYSLAHGVFQDGALCGTAELTLVVFDLAARRSVAVPEPVRSLVEALRPEG
jgi:acyl-CoA thioester hydrolase